jgi:hypothetical protein
MAAAFERQAGLREWLYSIVADSRTSIAQIGGIAKHGKKCFHFITLPPRRSAHVQFADGRIKFNRGNRMEQTMRISDQQDDQTDAGGVEMLAGDEVMYFNALVAARTSDSRSAIQLSGTKSAMLATFINDVRQKATRRYEEGLQRLAA